MNLEETYYCPFSIFGSPGDWLVECYYDGSNHYSVHRGSCLKAVLDEMVAEMKETAAYDGFAECEFVLCPSEERGGPLSAQEKPEAI